jgi:hypothetical protein
MSFRPVSSSLEGATRAGVLVECAKYWTLTGFDLPNSHAMAVAAGASPSAIEITRSAMDAGTTDSTWASDLVSYAQAQAAWVATQPTNLFDALRPATLQLSFRSRVALYTSTAVGSQVGEGQPKPVSKLTISSADLREVKSSGTVVAADELLRFGNPIVFSRLLGVGLSKGQNPSVMTRLTEGSFVETGMSGSGDAEDVGRDVRTLLGMITYGSDAQLRMIVDQTTAAAWATMCSPSGQAFYQLGNEPASILQPRGPSPEPGRGAGRKT